MTIVLKLRRRPRHNLDLEFRFKKFLSNVDLKLLFNSVVNVFKTLRPNLTMAKPTFKYLRPQMATSSSKYGSNLNTRTQKKSRGDTFCLFLLASGVFDKETVPLKD